jgi:hypothetical protein
LDPTASHTIIDKLRIRVIELKERRKKHAINKVVKENPHLGYDNTLAIFKI